MNSDMAKAILAKIQEKKASAKERWDYVPSKSTNVPPFFNNIYDFGKDYYSGFIQTLSPSNFLKNFGNKVFDNFKSPPTQPVGDTESDLAKRILLLTGGLGIGAGGLYALNHALRPSFKDKKKLDTDVALQYPVTRTEKQSSLLDDILGSPKAKSIWDNPLFVPGITLAGLGAAYGGFRGTQNLVEAVKAKAMHDEEQKAKKDFHDVLIDSYEKPLRYDPHNKIASDNTLLKLSSTIDEIYNECFEKKALSSTSGGIVPTTLAAALPLYLTAGLLTGVGTGSMAYDATKRHSKAEALKKALRERARLKYEQSPPELYISPEAIDVSELKKQRSSVV